MKNERFNVGNGMEGEFHVVWEIDVIAKDHAEAASVAREMQLGRTTATVFKVNSKRMKVNAEKEIDIGPFDDEPMDASFALFNCHKNNAEERAIQSYIGFFGRESFDANIKPYLDKGIMSILQTQPTPTLQFFVYTVWNFVNGY